MKKKKKKKKKLIIHDVSQWRMRDRSHQVIMSLVEQCDSLIDIHGEDFRR